ncbi:hypothetical protein NQ315_003246, partial [Exocentrus adspersus]
TYVNCNLAHNRLQHLLKKLETQNLYEEYEKVFLGWRDEGIIENVDKKFGNPLHYLPHRPVIKENSTTRVRSVFDAGAREKGNLSLNQCLEKGVNLIEKIPNILIRFREYRIGVVSDIRKAFLQIAVHEDDRNFISGSFWILFLLGATIEHHLTQYQKNLECSSYIKYTTETVSNLSKTFYVDNCVTSVDSEENLKSFIQESIQIMEEAKFDLRGWIRAGSLDANDSLHVFCDASSKAYACVIYLRIEYDQHIYLYLLASKSRVAPKKAITGSAKEKEHQIRIRTNSRIAAQKENLNVISGATLLLYYHGFAEVKNGEHSFGIVSEIRTLTSSPTTSWRHVPGVMNPADLPSRGCSAKILLESRWWEGPSWLRQEKELWPQEEGSYNEEEINKERKKKIETMINRDYQSDFHLDYFAKYNKIIRMMAWIFRVFHNAKKENMNFKNSGPLSVEEIDHA